jgi:poly(beta-D-mannuronate) lyase
VAFKFDAETDDYGIYNIEYLIIRNSEFEDVGGSVASIYRGGRDESTFGPHAFISDTTFVNVGAGAAPLAVLHGVQNMSIEGNTLDQTEPAQLVITTGKPKVVISNNSNAAADAIDALATKDMR